MYNVQCTLFIHIYIFIYIIYKSALIKKICSADINEQIYNFLNYNLWKLEVRKSKMLFCMFLVDEKKSYNISIYQKSACLKVSKYSKNQLIAKTI